MKNLKTALQRPLFSVIALAIGLAGLLPVLNPVSASAFGQVATRSIEMSSATPSASGGSYSVTYTPASATVIKGIVVDFCAGTSSPLAGDTCTAPAGFTVGAGSVSGVNVSGETGGTWTASSVNSGRTFELTNGSAGGTVSGATTFTITGVTNPSTTGEFYARVFTFANTADVTTWNGTSDGSATANVIDFGGFALSTVTQMTITARVQESLTFCVSKIDLSALDCTSATDPSQTIGHTSGANTILDNSATDTIHAFTQLSTNASGGAIVRLKDTSSTACAGLSSNGGTSCGIAAVNAGCSSSCTATAIPAGTNALIGACVTPGSGNTSAYAPYNDGTCANYGMDDNVFGTYGSQLFHATSAVLEENDDVKFAATAQLTTPAGIYSANYSMIATGTF